MISIKLNDYIKQDIKYIQEMQKMGIPEDIIQTAYDRTQLQKKEKERKGSNNELE